MMKQNNMNTAGNTYYNLALLIDTDEKGLNQSGGD